MARHCKSLTSILSLPQGRGRSKAQENDQYSIVHLGDFVSDSSRFHPAHREQVAERFEQAIPDTVVTGARESRICRDRDFNDAESFHLDQRGEKAMRAVAMTFRNFRRTQSLLVIIGDKKF